MLLRSFSVSLGFSGALAGAGFSAALATGLAAALVGTFAADLLAAAVLLTPADFAVLDAFVAKLRLLECCLMCCPKC
ncbi:MAG: hypothetical protein SF172_07300 [Burkholderiales bacterium]|nr:hypothetical protein [Burkholderiales bacterium]